MINYELLEAINANKIMKKEEKIKKALLLIEQLTNKKPVLKEGVSPNKSDKFLLYRKASNSPSPGHGEYLYASGSSLVELFNNWILTMKQGGYGYSGADLEEQIANFEKNPVKFWSTPTSFYILKYKKSLSEPATKQVVTEAAKIVSKDVLAPKVVRDGLLKETVEKPIKRRFYAITDDFEKQAKRLLAFYNDMLVLHPELKSEASKIKRALGSIEQTFTNTEMFINENKQGEQLELDLKEDIAPIKDERDFVQLWWDDLHPLEGVELGKKYFPDKHYSDITKEDIQVIFDNEVTNKKEETLTEDVAGMTTANMAVADSGLGVKPVERKKEKLQEAETSNGVSAGDTVDTNMVN